MFFAEFHHEFVEHTTKRPKVGRTRADAIGLKQLWGHVRRGPLLAFGVVGFRRHRRGQAKVAQFQRAEFIDENVGRFEIPKNQSAVMHKLQASDDISGQAPHRTLWKTLVLLEQRE